MEKLFWLFCAMLAISVIMLLLIHKNKSSNASAKEWWYLIGLVGCFGLLSNLMSFQAVLLSFVIISGVLWGVNRWWLSKRCNKESGETANSFVEFMSSIFSIILLVFVIRSFVVEPFNIPSSSMRPGLVVGDFILVNKFTYGIRMPISNNVVIPENKVSRGDVVVFNYPMNPKIDYIKRVIGLPGDIVNYKDKVLTINGNAVSKLANGSYKYADERDNKIIVYANKFKEHLGDKSIDVLNIDSRLSVYPSGVKNFPYRQNCQYDEDGTGFTCKVPQGYYFMMGDNRDDSEDGRYWGFVSDKLLVGKAFFIWMNSHDMSRVGDSVN